MQTDHLRFQVDVVSLRIPTLPHAAASLRHWHLTKHHLEHINHCLKVEDDGLGRISHLVEESTAHPLENKVASVTDRYRFG